MVVRFTIAAAVVVVLAALAWWLERRRRADAPTQARAAVAPTQLDRHDFTRPDAPWLVVLFTSSTCASCAGLYEKAAPLESDDVAVEEVEYTADKPRHERYHVEAAPLTLIADRDGIVRDHFFGTFAATTLWNALADLRAETA